jgi:hypothetical protein
MALVHLSKLVFLSVTVINEVWLVPAGFKISCSRKSPNRLPETLSTTIPNSSYPGLLYLYFNPGSARASSLFRRAAIKPS